MLASTVLGTIPTWILVALALFVAWRISRGGGGTAVSELSKANEVLTRRVKELGDEVRDLRIENVKLRASTDFKTAIGAELKPITDWAEGHERSDEGRHRQVATLLELHEQRATQRHDAQLKESGRQTAVLEMVADALANLGVKET